MIVNAKSTDIVRIEIVGQGAISAPAHVWLAYRDNHDRLLATCKEVLAWATRECMPQGGKNDGPWELVESAIARAEGKEVSE